MHRWCWVRCAPDPQALASSPLRPARGCWTSTGKQHDPAYATSLVRLAQNTRSENPTEALWLARRAMRVDPANQVAADLDDKWSTNPFAPTAVTLMLSGIAAVGTSLVLGVL